jgi:hypothetical protein
VNRKELIEVLEDEQLMESEQLVVIRTDKQLLPNADYVFAIEVDDDFTIAFRPTMRRVES